MLNFVHHVHYVVKDLTGMIDYLEKNFDMKPIKLYETKSGKDALYEVGKTHIQITEPTNPDGRPAKLLREHGPGVLHVAWSVDDIGELAKKLAANGNRIHGDAQGLTSSPRGYKTINIEESDSHGIWFQLAEGEHQFK